MVKKTVFTAAAALLVFGTLNAFELTTRIFPADEKVTLRLKAVSPWALDWIEKNSRPGVKPMKDSRKRVVPAVGYAIEDHSYTPKELFISRPVPQKVDFRIEGKEVVVNMQLIGENMHGIVFSKPPQPPGTAGAAKS